jgi:protoheme IX farnesyltransferase
MSDGAVVPNPSPETAGAAETASAAGVASAYLELTKPRITFMVLVTTAVGFVLGLGVVPQIGPGPIGRGALPLALFFHTLVGTALVASSASALNMIMERRLDALMRRTAGRPLPTGRIDPLPALFFALTLGVLGVSWLALAVNPLTAVLGALTLLSYVLVYTPMKRVSSLSTVVGAAPGAMPPVMGWAACTGELGPGAWALFGILFFWQLPHFLAIAWMYRADYAEAGFPMLPVIEPDGASTARQAVLWSVALVPLSLVPSALGLTGLVYAVGALVLGLVYVAASVTFGRERTGLAARRLLLTSVVYLPGLLGIMLADRLLG